VDRKKKSEEISMANPLLSCSRLPVLVSAFLPDPWSDRTMILAKRASVVWEATEEKWWECRGSDAFSLQRFCQTCGPIGSSFWQLRVIIVER